MRENHTRILNEPLLGRKILHFLSVSSREVSYSWATCSRLMRLMYLTCWVCQCEKKGSQVKAFSHLTLQQNRKIFHFTNVKTFCVCVLAQEIHILSLKTFIVYWQQWNRLRFWTDGDTHTHTHSKKKFMCLEPFSFASVLLANPQEGLQN